MLRVSLRGDGFIFYTVVLIVDNSKENYSLIKTFLLYTFLTMKRLLPNLKKLYMTCFLLYLPFVSSEGDSVILWTVCYQSVDLALYTDSCNESG